MPSGMHSQNRSIVINLCTPHKRHEDLHTCAWPSLSPHSSLSPADSSLYACRAPPPQTTCVYHWMAHARIPARCGGAETSGRGTMITHQKIKPQGITWQVALTKFTALTQPIIQHRVPIRTAPSPRALRTQSRRTPHPQLCVPETAPSPEPPYLVMPDPHSRLCTSPVPQ
ncbi:hypothetical protein BD779DRAFT_560685 [Infundibulicybe gibba]|nr:hypothetical protein BD779DRAFT_560685 [Infundibulicybe gibba]